MYRKTTLSNDITVVTESIPYFSTISIGIWWKVGGRFEDESNNGICHFIEHMLFKGTTRRTAHDIAREMDAVGGTLNAFTGKESTCLYARVLRKDTDMALDILADMYAQSTFNKEDIEKEKYVIAQEIKMIDDNPEEYVYDLFNATYFSNHALGMPILGTQKNVERFTKESLLAYFNRYYQPQNVIITATGRIDHDNFVRKIETLFGGRKPSAPLPVMVSPVPHAGVHFYEKDLEHVYLCIGSRGVSQVDQKRYALYVLNALLGGSMSSHLFQEIREKRGLVYNIYSYVNCYHDAGTFGISTSTSNESVEEVIALIRNEILRIRDKGITDAELTFSKKHIKGDLLISLENSESKMGRLAKNELYFGSYIPLKDTLRAIDSISKSDVNEISRFVFSNPEDLSLTILGNVNKKTVEDAWKN
ncbi:MAG: insulinase family protein [Syntrophobacterales bacterium]|jgi:predicted Zn-dependent peptidase|nr:insulinase family protein [Syntrophobacterales bacterium]